MGRYASQEQIEQIEESIRCGDTESVKQFLETHKETRHLPYERWIEEACIAGRLECLAVLWGASVYARRCIDSYALLACSHGHRDCYEFLVSNGYEEGESALCMASLRGHIHLVQAITERSTLPIDWTERWVESVRQGQCSMARWIWETKCSETITRELLVELFGEACRLKTSQTAEWLSKLLENAWVYAPHGRVLLYGIGEKRIERHLRPSLCSCPICFEKRSAMFHLRCSHAFCTECLSRLETESCPLCRFSLDLPYDVEKENV